MQQECAAWVDDFTLEPDLIQSAVRSYLRVAEADDSESAEVVATLRQLRLEMGRVMGNEERAARQVEHLESVAGHLDRALQHAEALQREAGSEDALVLRRRLAAARALVGTVRAALARRGRPTSSRGGNP
jgi:hypothetical protein